MNIYDIFEEDMNIVDFIERQVENLPYNDFEYNGYNDLRDWNLTITNKQYAQVLMLKNDIDNFSIVNDELYINYEHREQKKLKVFKDKEYGYYKVDDNP